MKICIRVSIVTNRNRTIIAMELFLYIKYIIIEKNSNNPIKSSIFVVDILDRIPQILKDIDSINTKIALILN